MRKNNVTLKSDYLNDGRPDVRGPDPRPSIIGVAQALAVFPGGLVKTVKSRGIYVTAPEEQLLRGRASRQRLASGALRARTSADGRRAIEKKWPVTWADVIMA